MSRTHKTINLIGIVGPLVGLLVAIGLLWDRMVGPTELAMLAVGYLLTGLGVTVGFHRLFSHRSFQTYPAVRYAFAVLGQLAIEGNVITWVADHRKHHRFSDHEGGRWFASHPRSNRASWSPPRAPERQTGRLDREYGIRHPQEAPQLVRDAARGAHRGLRLHRGICYDPGEVIEIAGTAQVEFAVGLSGASRPAAMRHVTVATLLLECAVDSDRCGALPVTVGRVGAVGVTSVSETR